MTNSVQEGAGSPAPFPSKLAARPGRRARLGYEIHAVRIDQDLVALDLRRNLYLCVQTNEGSASSPHGCGQAPLARLLNRAGLNCEHDPTHSSPYRPASKPRDDVGEVLLGGICARDALEAGLATLDLWLNYPGRSLSELISLVEQQAARSSLRTDAAAARRLARRFQRWIALAPVSDKCLVRSFMLLRYLHRHGLSADWAFAVRTWPFRAHCWVQSDGLALDEAAERLVAYAPLMMVRC